MPDDAVFCTSCGRRLVVQGADAADSAAAADSVAEPDGAAAAAGAGPRGPAPSWRPAALIAGGVVLAVAVVLAILAATGVLGGGGVAIHSASPTPSSSASSAQPSPSPSSAEPSPVVTVTDPLTELVAQMSGTWWTEDGEGTVDVGAEPSVSWSGPDGSVWFGPLYGWYYTDGTIRHDLTLDEVATLMGVGTEELAGVEIRDGFIVLYLDAEGMLNETQVCTVGGQDIGFSGRYYR